ncbi:MAG TPA: exopolysaccharide biosynthesis polyprenyl glycosylphosphotransferase [Candidatus Krumholzibacteria bacterium]|nr:exopolysaccharide biosynthesis polyprenyl glycosylphosphotransferase [Candidatus Krumholzibacteria bacterium]
MKKDATALDLATINEVVEAHEPLRLRIGSPRYAWWERAIKRAFDIVFALTVLALGAPAFFLIGLLVKLSSPGPVLFCQTRLGRDGRPFVFYKFRSMRHNNDDQVHREFCADFISGNGQDEPQVFKMVEDPRVTRIGGFLRRTSLDELPQFWNVLKGEMSVVGPRPPIAYEYEHYQEWHKDRLKVKPGLTGLWQVSGRSQVGFDEMVMLDLHYISRWSLLLDLRIVARTLPVMVRGEGAY